MSDTSDLMVMPNMVPGQKAEESNILDRLEGLDGDIEDAEIISTEETSEESEEEIEAETESDEDDEGEVDELEEGEEPSLAAYLGVEEHQITTDEEGQVFVSTKIDGEVKTLPFSEVIAGYQMQSSLTQNQMKLSDERKSFDTERTQVQEEIQNNLHSSMFVAKHMEDELLTEYNKINWDSLRVQNPAEYTALRQDYADKAKGIENLKTRASEAVGQFQQEQFQQNQQAQFENAQQEKASLLLRRPALADQKVYNDTMTSARKFLTETYGVEEDEIEQIFDHRLVSMILDAQNFHKGKTEIQKKVKDKPVPKFQKPGARRHSGMEKARAAKAKKAALKSSGSTQSVADAIVDRI